MPSTIAPIKASATLLAPTTLSPSQSITSAAWDLRQALAFELAVTVAATATLSSADTTIRYEVSDDGTTWRPLVTVAGRPAAGDPFVSVADETVIPPATLFCRTFIDHPADADQPVTVSAVSDAVNGYLQS